MEKSKVPTSQYQVFCDTYDMKGEAKIHQASGKNKLLLSLTKEGKDESLSLSLYREDVEMLADFLASVVDKLDRR